MRPRSTRPSITLCMMPRLTKRSTYLELTLSCLVLMLIASVSSSSIRSSLRPLSVVFVSPTVLTSNALKLAVNMLPTPSLQTAFFKLLRHLRLPVQQRTRLVLLHHTPPHQMFLTFVLLFRAADAARYPTLVGSSKSLKICAVTRVCSLTGTLTPPSATPPIVHLPLFLPQLLQWPSSSSSGNSCSSSGSSAYVGAPSAPHVCRVRVVSHDTEHGNHKAPQPSTSLRVVGRNSNSYVPFSPFLAIETPYITHIKTATHARFIFLMA